MTLLLDMFRWFVSIWAITLPIVLFALFAATLARHRHTKRDWFLALPLLAYFPAILAFGSVSKHNSGADSRVTVWSENVVPIVLVILLIHCVAAIWLSNSRLLASAIAPLALCLALMAAMVTEMTLNNVWF
jgi:hypothetical protein